MSRAGAALALCALLAAGPGCSKKDREAAPAATPETASRRSAAEGDLGEPPVGDAHGAHAAQGIACEVCHYCGNYAFDPAYQLSSGATLATGQLVRGASGTTCTVACHGSSAISWSAAGPLACIGCHVEKAPGDDLASSHAADASTPEANRDACARCHDVSAHMSGTVRVVTVDGLPVDLTDPTQVNALCTSCHDGTGEALAGETPPLLVGWTSPTGDWHGSRAGPVFGTVLATPWTTGQAAMPCVACHDAHASSNPYLFAAAPNAVAIPAGAVARGGQGAEVLCATCHRGTRHARCATAECHGYDPAPAGTSCFFCHGHEGVQNISIPVGSPDADSKWKCNHCHSAVPLPALDTTPPLVSNVVVRILTASQATIEWYTSENATSYVEWGTSAPGNVTGRQWPLVGRHSVTLPPLTELTRYWFRVRSVDAQRNVAQTQLVSFDTPSVHAPTQPVVVPRGSTVAPVETVPVTLTWKASAAEGGHPVKYRLVLAPSADFAAPIVDSGWIDPTSFSTTLPAGLEGPLWYHWRVQAYDTVNGTTSAWSAPSAFYLMLAND